MENEAITQPKIIIINIFRRVLLLLFGLLFISPTNLSATVFSIQISNHNAKNKIVLELPNSQEKKILIDQTGKAKLEFSDFTSGYALLRYEMGKRIIWLEPDKDLSISFDGGSFAEEITFTDSLAAINHYLNVNRLKAITINDCELDEKQFIAKTDSLLNSNLQILQQAKLPKYFSDIEATRLNYFTFSGFIYFPEFQPRIGKDKTYTPSSTYLSRLKELCVLDDSLLKLDEYKNYLSTAVSILAKEDAPNIKLPIDRNTAYVEKHIDKPAMAEFLINRYVYAYIKNNSSLNSEKYLSFFHRFVKNKAMIDEMKKLTDKWNRLNVGNPSPDFNATDLNGKKITLADFKGKYVYIDIWATWCGPCLKEMPYLIKLEEKYKDNDIYFISLSCDADRKTWEKFLIKENKTGIQIHLVPGDSFMEDYMIAGVPHFILLDKDGSIINSTMTRPSEHSTIEILDKLLNKH